MPKRSYPQFLTKDHISLKDTLELKKKINKTLKTLRVDNNLYESEGFGLHLVLQCIKCYTI